MLESSFISPDELKEFSVGELSNKIKEILESNLRYIKVRGEISGLKIASSGHAYFNLKDNSAILSSTCWRPILAKVPFQLGDGIEVIASGKITSYGGQSRYQLSVERLEPAGIGAMMQILKKRKSKLENEGLFDQSLKKPLPFMPAKIGIVTSITGAVIQDIIHRITDRAPTHIIVWPVTVQGETAAKEVANAIDEFNKMDEHARPKLLIVARGGGSIEDLWPFNEEIVVRSVHASHIPVISAVGHETDYTLIDLAADVRAPTPTAAAEFAVPVASDLKYTLSLYHSKLLSRIKNLVEYKHQTIINFDRILRYRLNYINLVEQKLDEINFKLLESLPNHIKTKTIILSQFPLSRLKPDKILNYKTLELNHLTLNLHKVISKTLDDIQYKLNLSSLSLASLDYENILKRGFALISNDEGHLLTSFKAANVDDKFNIRFADGVIRAKKL